VCAVSPYDPAVRGRIEREDGHATQRVGLGSAIAFRALANREIDVYVDYSGTVWANFMGRTDTPPRDVVLAELTDWLRETHGVTLVGALGFENAYALAMRRVRAEELGITSIENLARHAGSLRIGGDFEFFSRPEWQALRDAYGLHFANTRQYQSTFMYEAVASGEVDVISAFSSDGRIAAEDLMVLDDPRQVILPYDAILLVSGRRTGDPLLQCALTPLVGAISIDSMREANLMVDRDAEKASPAEAARWLAGRAAPGRSSRPCRSGATRAR
jgi:osmoprotectant transport system permease protein